jgi:hypothetical protein
LRQQSEHLQALPIGLRGFLPSSPNWSPET